MLAALEGERGARFQILDARDQLVVLRDLLLILGDGDGHRTAGCSDRIGAVAYLLAQNDQRVAVDDFLCGFVGVTPHERK